MACDEEEKEIEVKTIEIGNGTKSSDRSRSRARINESGYSIRDCSSKFVFDLYSGVVRPCNSQHLQQGECTGEFVTEAWPPPELPVRFTAVFIVVEK
jgi:hypothetical protein